MSETDIWVSVLEHIGYKFIDEHCGKGIQNKLIFHRRDHDLVDPQGNSEVVLWFNRKSEVVDSVMVSDWITSSSSKKKKQQRRYLKNHIRKYFDISK